MTTPFTKPSHNPMISLKQARILLPFLPLPFGLRPQVLVQPRKIPNIIDKLNSLLISLKL